MAKGKDLVKEAIAATRAVVLPDLVRAEDLARHLGISVAKAREFLLEVGGAEIAGVAVITRADLLAALRVRGNSAR